MKKYLFSMASKNLQRVTCSDVSATQNNINGLFFSQWKASRQLVTGIVVEPNKAFSVTDTSGAECLAEFTAEAVEHYVKNASRSGINNAVILEHNGKAVNFALVESILIDSQRGIFSPSCFGNRADRTWIVTAWIQDKKLYNELKQSSNARFKINQTSLSTAMKNAHTATPYQFGRMKISDGSFLLWKGTLKQGTEIQVEIDGGKGDPLPVPVGVYTFESGTQIEVDTLSKVSRIAEKASRTPTKFGSVNAEGYAKFLKRHSDKTRKNPLKNIDAWRNRYMR